MLPIMIILGVILCLSFISAVLVISASILSASRSSQAEEGYFDWDDEIVSRTKAENEAANPRLEVTVKRGSKAG